jgi:hypothetical protein
MWEVMAVCMIMDNMTVEPEHDNSVRDKGWDNQGKLTESQGGPATFQEFLHVHHEIHGPVTHVQPLKLVQLGIFGLM